MERRLVQIDESISGLVQCALRHIMCTAVVTRLGGAEWTTNLRSSRPR
jgi:hypothetical protein